MFRKPRELSEESFVETFGVVSRNKRNSDDITQVHRKRILFQTFTNNASRIIRSVSLKKKSQISNLRRCSTISAPDTFVYSTKSTAKTSSGLAIEKSKLLKEIMAQREELLKEQRLLENLMNEARISKDKKQESRSQSSLQSFDNGYCSNDETENDHGSLQIRRTQSTRNFTNEHKADKQHIDIGEDVLAEIEEFEAFTKKTLKKIAEEQST